MTPADLTALRERLIQARRNLLAELWAQGLDRHPSPSLTREIAAIEATITAIDREASA